MSEPPVELVVAVAANGVIGAEGDMPWRLSTDLRRFKEITMGGVLVMGRRTFDSIGRPLPGRTTVVVTRDRTWAHEGVHVAHGVEEALDLARTLAGEDGVFVVGGGEIYRQAMPFVTRAHITTVHAEPAGDTRFEGADGAGWRTLFSERIEAGERDDFATTYTIRERVPAT